MLNEQGSRPSSDAHALLLNQPSIYMKIQKILEVLPTLKIFPVNLG